MLNVLFKYLSHSPVNSLMLYPQFSFHPIFRLFLVNNEVFTWRQPDTAQRFRNSSNQNYLKKRMDSLVVISQAVVLHSAGFENHVPAKNVHSSFSGSKHMSVVQYTESSFVLLGWPPSPNNPLIIVLVWLCHCLSLFRQLAPSSIISRLSLYFPGKHVTCLKKVAVGWF